MTISETELKEILEMVPNSYPEFVKSSLRDAREFGIGDEIADFVIENPGLSSGYVIGFVLDRLGFTEPLRIVKDK